MAKINDTTVFPVTTPAADDLLFGTDVSNTANSADGETVNFTAAGVLGLLANGASGVPKVQPAGFGGYYGQATRTSVGVFLTITDLDDVSAVMVGGAVYADGSSGDPATAILQYRLSSDNGVTWGSYQTLTTSDGRDRAFPVAVFSATSRSGASTTDIVDTSAHNAIEISLGRTGIRSVAGRVFAMGVA